MREQLTQKKMSVKDINTKAGGLIDSLLISDRPEKEIERLLEIIEINRQKEIDRL
jgi:hypothetical protein